MREVDRARSAKADAASRRGVVSGRHCSVGLPFLCALFRCGSRPRKGWVRAGAGAARGGAHSWGRRDKPAGLGRLHENRRQPGRAPERLALGLVVDQSWRSSSRLGPQLGRACATLSPAEWRARRAGFSPTQRSRFAVQPVDQGGGGRAWRPWIVETPRARSRADGSFSAGWKLVDRDAGIVSSRRGAILGEPLVCHGQEDA